MGMAWRYPAREPRPSSTQGVPPLNSRTLKLVSPRLADRRGLGPALDAFGLLFHGCGFVGQFEFRTRCVVLHIVGEVIGAGKRLAGIFDLAASEQRHGRPQPGGRQFPTQLSLRLRRVHRSSLVTLRKSSGRAYDWRQ